MKKKSPNLTILNKTRTRLKISFEKFGSNLYLFCFVLGFQREINFQYVIWKFFFEHC